MSQTKSERPISTNSKSERPTISEKSERPIDKNAKSEPPTISAKSERPIDKNAKSEQSISGNSKSEKNIKSYSKSESSISYGAKPGKQESHKDNTKTDLTNQPANYCGMCGYHFDNKTDKYCPDCGEERMEIID